MARSLRNRLSTPVVMRIVLISLAACVLIFHVTRQVPNHEHPKKKKTTPNFHRSAPFNRSTKVKVGTTKAVSPCRRCVCDCLPEVDSVLLPLDFFNSSSYSDCGKQNLPEMEEEMNKDRIALLSEEIKLRNNVTRDYLHSIQQSITEVKQTSSKYQKEAEKCNRGVQICEEGRERAEVALTKELNLSALWEQRARELGWAD